MARNTSAAIRRLIVVCQDGNQGFRTAADCAGSADLKRLFSKLALEREEFIEQLGRKLETPVALRGSSAGALHRAWICVVGRSTGALLRECVRGENAAIDQYERALRAGLPEELSALVQAQLSYVAEARNRLADLAREAED